MTQKTGTPAKVCKTKASAERDESHQASKNENSIMPRGEAMGAATPLRHDAHLCSPAGWVNQDAKSRLRRKQEPNYGISEIKTPAKGQLVAEVFDCQNTRGASERPELSLNATGTIAKNAWLVARVYRVHQNLMVDLQHG